MTQQKKNIILICVAIFLGSYIFRGAINSMLRLPYYRPPAARAKRPNPKSTASATATQASVPEPIPVRNLSGVWLGNALVKDKGSCHLNLELRRQPDNTTYSAYTVFVCSDYLARARDKSPDAGLKMIEEMKPESALLTGKPQNSAIHFTVDKAIQPDTNGCSVTDFTVTPFGDHNIAAEWQSGKCPGGNMIMSRKQ